MNLSRQLKRVKQQADHLFLRTDRTDVVGELRGAEEQVDEVRVLCEAYTRALDRALHTHTAPDDKKLRKVPQYQAAEVLKEGLLACVPADGDHNHTLIRDVVGRVVEVEQALGIDLVEFEEQVDKQVLSPLTCLIKDDLPSITKQKKQLKQVGLDLDAAKTRLRSSQTNPPPGAPLGVAGAGGSGSGGGDALTAANAHTAASSYAHTKADTYREEMEEAISRLDNARDMYACDIFSMLSRERQICEHMCAYLELRRGYMVSALTRLDLALPDLRAQVTRSTLGPVFGVSLRDHLMTISQDIALVIRVCVCRILQAGLYEEGLLRVTGSAAKVRRLKAAFDGGLVSTPAALLAADEQYDAHVVSGTLKCYLRELPEPLLTHLLHQQWLDAVKITDHQQRLKAIWLVTQQLPRPNLTNLTYLIQFLHEVSVRAHTNKMTAANLAIVMAPNLIWAASEGHPGPAGPADMATLGRNMTLSNSYRTLTECLIQYADYFFKDKVDFGVQVCPSPSVGEANGPHVHRLTHRRTASTDNNITAATSAAATEAATATATAAESPKQPQRTRKKQAPRPPQGRPVSSCGAHTDTDTHSDTYDTHTLPRTHTHAHTEGESDTHTPVPRLHHTSSLRRRPTTQPPQPPQPLQPAATKPPRPQPPNLDPVHTAIGFEPASNNTSHNHIITNNPVDIDMTASSTTTTTTTATMTTSTTTEGEVPVGFPEPIIPPEGESCPPKTPARILESDGISAEPPKAATPSSTSSAAASAAATTAASTEVELPPAPATTQEEVEAGVAAVGSQSSQQAAHFKHSLENVLQNQQISGSLTHPHPMPRQTAASGMTTAAASETENQPPLPSQPPRPTPAQRTSIPAKPMKPEKPALPEKPAAITAARPQPTAAATDSRQPQPHAAAITTKQHYTDVEKSDGERASDISQIGPKSGVGVAARFVWPPPTAAAPTEATTAASTEAASTTSASASPRDSTNL